MIGDRKLTASVGFAVAGWLAFCGLLASGAIAFGWLAAALFATAAITGGREMWQ